LEELSGSWVGFWKQGPNKGQMTLYLSFRHKQISGTGEDSIGGFEIHGAYSTASYSVQFIKTYRTHDVLYEGILEGRQLKGSWVLQGRSRSFLSFLLGYCGTFEIWQAR
jgi:hypothetical protein